MSGVRGQGEACARGLACPRGGTGAGPALVTTPGQMFSGDVRVEGTRDGHARSRRQSRAHAPEADAGGRLRAACANGAFAFLADALKSPVLRDNRLLHLYLVALHDTVATFVEVRPGVRQVELLREGF